MYSGRMFLTGYMGNGNLRGSKKNRLQSRSCLRSLGFLKRCLYLGDTNTDMETGKNAQVDTVGVLWGFRSRDELKVYEPALLAEHPMDVAEFIKGVNHIE